MRLIDAEIFPNKLKEMMIQIDKNRGKPEEDWFLYGFDEFVLALDVIDLVKEMPTVDAVPVRRGHWLNKGEHAICSECGASSGTQCNGLELIPRFSKYCPDCGAKMDKE